MAVTIQIRRGLAASWTSTNPVLAQGEMGMELDTRKFKFGDGVSTWTALNYAGGSIDSINGQVGVVSLGVGELDDVDLTGISVGQTIIWNGTSFEAGDAGAVDSVNSQTGAVVLNAGHIGVTPVGGVSSTNVQAAIAELDTDKQNALGFTPENSANRGAADGYAPLDSGSKVPAAYLPSYVDDVVEAADFASLPVTGEAGKIYVTLDTGNAYRWGGSSYVEIVASPGSTDEVAEGATNLYFTDARAKAAAVADAINNGVTDVAPSQNAVFDALALKAPLASPALTGTPTAPTASASDNSTKIATTAYADAAVAVETARAVAAEASFANKSLSNLTNPTAIGVNLNFSGLRAQSTYIGWLTHLVNDTVTFTVTPTVGSPFNIVFSVIAADNAVTNSGKLIAYINADATCIARGYTAYLEGEPGEWNAFDPSVFNHVYLKGPVGEAYTLTRDNTTLIDLNAAYNQGVASALPGKVTNLDTPTAGGDATNKTYVDGQVSTEASARASADTTLQTNIDAEAAARIAADALKAPLASPTFTGTPTAPTPAANDNSTKLATTAYVDTVIASTADTDTLSVDNSDTAVVGDYTQTGLEILSTAGLLINGTKTLRLIHQSGSPYSFKKVHSVDPKFRGRSNTLTLWNRSTASEGNVTILVTDETNSTTLYSDSVQTDSASMSMTTTNASATVAISSSDALLLKSGMSVTGAGIPTGTTILSVSSTSFLMSQNATASATITGRYSELPSRRSCSFDVPTTCASISYTITALAESGSPETYVDDIVIKLTSTSQTSASLTTTTYNVQGPNNYTPAIAGMGTPTNVDFSWEQRGHIMVIKGGATAGASPSGAVSIPLPSGFSIDTTSPNGIKKINGGGAKVGTVFCETSSGTAQSFYAGGYSAIAFYDGSDTSNIYFGLQTQSGAFLKQAWTTFGSASEGGTFEIEVPISGWTNTTTETTDIPLTSAVLVTEPDSELRITGFSSLTGTTATRIVRLLSATTPGTIQRARGDAIKIEDDAANGARITALKDGIYSFNVSADWEPSGSAGVGFSLNSTTLTTNWTALTGAEKLGAAYDGGGSFIIPSSWTGWLNAGDVVRLHSTAALSYSADTTYSTFQVSYQGKTRIINPSSDQKIAIPTSEIRFDGANSRGATSTGIVKFDTLTAIRGDGMSVESTAALGTTITILKEGVLTVSATLYSNASGIEWDISRNQTVLTSTPTVATEFLAATYAAGTSAAYVGNPSWTGTVKVGDKIRISSNGNPTANSGNSLKLLLQEQKVQVALSNVTPQFTDSDAYLELNTHNGTGSTYNKVVRFSNLVRQDSTGKMTYTDSATEGAKLEINETGLYFITASVPGPTGNYAVVGLTKNEVLATTGTTALSSTTIAQGRIAMSHAPSTANYGGPQVSFFGNLSKGDIIRVKADGATSNDATAAYFQAVKVGKPSFAAIDVTPFVNLKAQDFEAIESTNNAATWGSTNTGVALLTIKSNTNRGIIRVDSGATTGTSFVVLRDCRMLISAGANPNTAGVNGVYITKNETVLTTGALTASATLAYASATANNHVVMASANVELKAGDVIRVQRDSTNLTESRSVSLIAIADSTSVVAAAKTYRMSDILAAGTRVTTTPAALGEYRSRLRNANAQTFTDTNGTPTATPSAANGIRIYNGNAYTSADTNNEPTHYDIYIGRNKQYKIDWYGTTGRTGKFVNFVQILSGTDYGYKEMYDPTTGIITISANRWQTAATTHSSGIDDALNVVQDPYFDITVFDTPFVASSFQRKIAIIRDEKASGVNGGTLTAGSYVTRDLNTLLDPSGIVTSLSSNVFTLPAGRYRIRATAPGYYVGSHRLKLRNTTDSTDVILGQGAWVTASPNTQSTSTVEGVFTLATAKSLSLMHRCSTTKATDGMGVAMGFGETEVYTIVELEKLD